MNYVYTESACDACPRHCRAGIFVGGSAKHRPAVACPADTAPTSRPFPVWRVTDYVPSAPDPSIKLDTVTKVTR